MLFKANTKAVEQTVIAETNLGNKSKPKPNLLLPLAVEKPIDSPSKSTETPSVCFLLEQVEERLVTDLSGERVRHSLDCANMFIKLHCKMDP